MNKTERYIRTAINLAASEGKYEIAIQESLVPKEILEKLILEHYGLMRWKDNIIINWNVVDSN